MESTGTEEWNGSFSSDLATGHLRLRGALWMCHLAGGVTDQGSDDATWKDMNMIEDDQNLRTS